MLNDRTDGRPRRGRVLRRALLATAMIACALPALASPQEEEAVVTRPLGAGDPDLPIVREWLNQRRSSRLSTDLKVITVDEPVEITAPALERLFPAWRFHRLAWSEEYTKKGEKYKKKNGIVDSNSFEIITLGVKRESRRLIPFFDSGDYESFGELLAEDRIEIRSFAKAQAVWTAFCELHNKQWQSQAHDWPDAGHWRLNVTTIGDHCYYYEVILDDGGIAVAGRLKADRSQ